MWFFCDNKRTKRQFSSAREKSSGLFSTFPMRFGLFEARKLDDRTSIKFGTKKTFSRKMDEAITQANKFFRPPQNTPSSWRNFRAVWGPHLISLNENDAARLNVRDLHNKEPADESGPPSPNMAFRHWISLKLFRFMNSICITIVARMAQKLASFAHWSSPVLMQLRW